MNSQYASAIGMHHSGREGAPAGPWPALRARVAGFLEGYRRKRALHYLLPLDARTARDIGVRPLGVGATALAQRNELQGR